VVSTAAAQDYSDNLNNSIRAEHQFIHTGNLNTSIGQEDLGETDTHVVMLSGIWSPSERYQVSGAYYQTIDAEEVLEVDYAFTLALTRNF